MLRRKVLVHILAIMALTLCLFVFLSFLILRVYYDLESRQSLLDQERVENALRKEIVELRQIGMEWGEAGMLYALMHAPYDAQPFLDGALEVIAGSFNIDKSALFSTDGNLIGARGTAPEGRGDLRLSESDSFLRAVFEDDTLRQHASASRFAAGFALLDGRIHLIIAQPVVENVDATVSGGSLVLGSEFDSGDMATLSDTMRQSMDVIPWGDFSANPENSELAERLLNQGQELVLDPVSFTEMNGYTLFPDYRGDVAFVVKTTSQRINLRQAWRSIWINGTVLIALFVLLIVYLLYFFDRNVLKRLQVISQSVIKLVKNEALEERLLVSGNDEFTDFTVAFNGVLDSLEDTQNTLKHEREKAVTTLASIGDAVITISTAGEVEYMNPVAEKLTRWSIAEARGKSLEQVFSPTDHEGKLSLSLVQQCIKSDGGLSESDSNYLRDKYGKEIAIESIASPIRDADGETRGVVLVFRDVSEARDLQKTLAYQASHDTLTGLPNRREFERKLGLITSASRQTDKENHLLFIDLDRFKLVNDNCGHVTGDSVLVEIADIIKGHVRGDDMVARIGGDEFGILLVACNDVDAVKIAETIRESVSEYRFQSQGMYFTFGASVGVLNLSRHSEFGDGSALSAADSACMVAKNSGRNRIHVHKPEDDQELEQRQNLWITRINEALENDRFLLFGQQIMDISGDENVVTGYELLLRLQNSDGTLVSPGLFIPAAERYGLMVDIDKLVFGKFCHWLFSNPLMLESDKVFFLNLSGQSLGDETFAASLIRLLDESGIPPGKICFEITETAAIRSLSNARSFMDQLREKGCQLALDDFGSGLSSFAYLKQLPVDLVKIDGAFIKSMASSSMDRALVASMNDIAHIRGLKTIAEYVEDSAILQSVREMGIDYAQGYFLHSPQSVDSIRDESG
ncbi:MAG: EAL domain-containing protein [Pseudohongiellaceae bacterium]